MLYPAHLAPGWHAIRIVLTGTHRRTAKSSAIDIDAFVVVG